LSTRKNFGVSVFVGVVVLTSVHIFLGKMLSGLGIAAPVLGVYSFLAETLGGAVFGVSAGLFVALES